jgi:hypothetical protein
VLSSAEPNNAAPTQPDNQQAQRRHEALVNIPMKLSPTESPGTSLDDAVIISSPEQETDDDIAQLNYNELSVRHYEALTAVQQKSQELQQKSREFFAAQSLAWRLTKRLKTMQCTQPIPTSPTEVTADAQMESVD